MNALILSLLSILVSTNLYAQAQEMTFAFNRGGTPVPHIYILEWPNGNLGNVKVVANGSNELLQTIAIPQDQVSLPYDQVSQMRDMIVDIADYNFDNYADLRITKKWAVQHW